ncbi:MAG: SDR family oxidoreductase [Bdellovibrionales bacterium]|nr:SDR family oxidoreductase [Bdellovibrionales bacterium]NQZ18700.1 SDR family oxidoreductase [Bdellovibrionales bacterium]
MNTVIITGASSGIGRSIAQNFSEKGWKTLLVARNEERLKDLKSSLPNSEYFICDLSDQDQLKNLAKDLQPYFKDLKALVNNAGIYRPESIDNDNDQVWTQHFETNLMSAVRMTRVVWPTLKQNKGSILNISSTLAIRPIANAAAYSALKSAMNNWTLSLAIEGAPHGVKANAICPGLVDTPIHGFHNNEAEDMKNLKNDLQGIQPLGRMGQPQDIAATAVHMCGEDSSWTTGTILNIDGGILLNS